MPLYDYQCQHCQSVFEVRATFKEKEQGLKPKCPECQSKKTRQVMSTGLFVSHTDDGCSGCSGNCGSGCSCGR
ncbi:MAG: FmdB family zinc ribbon protein [Chloroflexota bacterium]|nr:zinc ribbon domain-containing protein [Anaerolineales bacterium]